MQNQEATQTLLDAQDLCTQLDFRGRTADRLERAPRARPRPLPHDFLVLSPRPDLTPELLPILAPAPVQSCERNMPAK